MISTHAPRTGSDWESRDILQVQGDFNPRSPHGERPYGRIKIAAGGVFQPTLPARGATGGINNGIKLGHFNPRSPHGERRNRSYQ